MGSTVIVIPDGSEGVAPSKLEKEKFDISCLPIISFLREKKRNRHGIRKVIHSIKVGVALVLVSLLYILDPLYEHFGENAMWAIFTVVVIFEFFAGATLSKGLNRGIGTVLGGGLGCLAASFAQAVGGVGKAIVVAIAVFIFGTAATYTRQVPNIKKKYEYGALIFILTFNLVVVSGLRAEQVLELARQRLSAIVMGFAICTFISLLVFPIWASDELHDSLVSRFEDLACFLEGFSKEYFVNVKEKEKKFCGNFSSNCKLVLQSKTKDESLVNFARWEPWHGKFGFSYPWGKYLKIGEDLRDLATTILSLRGRLRSPTQASETLQQSVIEPYEAIMASLAWTLKELGESIGKMIQCRSEETIVPKLNSVRLELSLILTPSTFGTNLENIDRLGLASFVYALTEMVEKMEELAKEVEELGKLGGFHKNISLS
ncbi:aluminum-activated malate transporter 8-like [Durio zibethinus]|uniref:Aluminum-activated malate transporter 8-like n=1 Tax=Durio zibethinus TaxID=66656 RepID=A0A6P5XI55_DURZI|nr:aluminum-activated malate transporter 8-like [Durio zibethinus]